MTDAPIRESQNDEIRDQACRAYRIEAGCRDTGFARRDRTFLDDFRNSQFSGEFDDESDL